MDAKKFWKKQNDENNNLKKELLRGKIADTVNAIYDQFDKDQSGQLSFMEYVQAAMSLPELADFMNEVRPSFPLSNSSQFHWNYEFQNLKKIGKTIAWESRRSEK